MVDYALFDTRPLPRYRRGNIAVSLDRAVPVLYVCWWSQKSMGIMGVEEGLKKSCVSIFTSIEMVVVIMQRAHVKIGEVRNALEEHPADGGLRLGLNGWAGPSRWAEVPCDPLMHDSRSAKS